jgi:hypothetical protein
VRPHTGFMGSLGQKVLAMVVAKLGIERTAKELGVSQTLVQRFLDGAIPVPDQVLLKAVDALEAPPDVPAVLPDSTKPKGPIII